VSPEYEDCLRVAEIAGVSVRAVYEAALRRNAECPVAVSDGKGPLASRSASGAPRHSLARASGVSGAGAKRRRGRMVRGQSIMASVLQCLPFRHPLSALRFTLHASRFTNEAQDGAFRRWRQAPILPLNPRITTRERGLRRSFKNNKSD